MADDNAAAETTTDAPERVTETWTCAGVRVDAKDRRLVAWVTPGNRQLTFPSGRGYVLGGRYEFRVSRTTEADGEVSTVYYGQPRYLGTRETDRELVASWTGRTLAAENKLRINALERKHKGENPVDKLLDPLVAYARKMRPGPQRRAFLAYVIERLGEAR